jgi:hypothetical protein
MTTPREPTDTWPSPVYGSEAQAAALANLKVPQPAIADVAAAPTQADFNGLLAALRTAGIIAAA